MPVVEVPGSVTSSTGSAGAQINAQGPSAVLDSTNGNESLVGAANSGSVSGSIDSSGINASATGPSGEAAFGDGPIGGQAELNTGSASFSAGQQGVSGQLAGPSFSETGTVAAGDSSLSQTTTVETPLVSANCGSDGCSATMKGKVKVSEDVKAKILGMVKISAHVSIEAGVTGDASGKATSQRSGKGTSQSSGGVGQRGGAASQPPTRVHGGMGASAELGLEVSDTDRQYGVFWKDGLSSKDLQDLKGSTLTAGAKKVVSKGFKLLNFGVIIQGKDYTVKSGVKRVMDWISNADHPLASD
jgi:hypothetical protein